MIETHLYAREKKNIRRKSEIFYFRDSINRCIPLFISRSLLFTSRSHIAATTRDRLVVFRGHWLCWPSARVQSDSAACWRACGWHVTVALLFQVCRTFLRVYSPRRLFIYLANVNLPVARPSASAKREPSTDPLSNQLSNQLSNPFEEETRDKSRRYIFVTRRYHSHESMFIHKTRNYAIVESARLRQLIGKMNDY